MDTRRNAPAVLAQFLRAALEQLQDAIRPRGSLRVVSQPERFAEAIDSIRAVAEALEDQARAPDPAAERFAITLAGRTAMAQEDPA